MAAKRFPDSPDTLRLTLKNQFHLRIAAAMPVEKLLALFRRNLQQQRSANGSRQARLSQIVWAVKNVQAMSKIQPRFPNAAEMLDAQRPQFHLPSPAVRTASREVARFGNVRKVLNRW